MDGLIKWSKNKDLNLKNSSTTSPQFAMLHVALAGPVFPQLNFKISCTSDKISWIFLKNIFVFPHSWKIPEFYYKEGLIKSLVITYVIVSY